MKLCLFGGSFDPVHSGHLTIAKSAVEHCGLDKVVFLPAAESPFKQGKTHLFSDAQRLELLRLATVPLPWAEVSELDLQLPPPSWSWRLVEHYRNDHPDAELFWLLGTDQWQELHRWGRYEYLIETLHFIVYHRGETPQPREGVRSTFLAGHHPASATDIRRALLNTTPLPDNWMPPAAEQRAREMMKDRDVR